jgi:acyl carrier protein
MEKVRIRKIIEDIIITQFLNSEIDIVHEEDVSFKELGLDSVDRIELDVMVDKNSILLLLIMIWRPSKI